MSMTKRRNHYLPQFLLRRFASRVDRKRHWLWQFRNGTDPVELGTRNAAVSTYFYGRPETGVEDALANLEGRQASLLKGLDEGVNPMERADELRSFVWSLAVRTRALRGQFAEAGVRTITQMKSVGADRMVHALQREIENRFDEHLGSYLEGLPVDQRRVVQQALELPGLLDLLRRQLVSEMQEAPPAIHALLESIRGLVPDAAASGHVKALAKFLAGAKNTPRAFSVPDWSIKKFVAHSVVLGDSAVFAVGLDGSPGVLGSLMTDYVGIYVPIAHDEVLVGRREEGAPTLGIKDINTASALVSLDTIFASRCSDEERGLACHIGTGEPLVSDDELARIARESWDGRGRPPATD